MLKLPLIFDAICITYILLSDGSFLGLQAKNNGNLWLTYLVGTVHNVDLLSSSANTTSKHGSASGFPGAPEMSSSLHSGENNNRSSALLLHTQLQTIMA